MQFQFSLSLPVRRLIALAAVTPGSAAGEGDRFIGQTSPRAVEWTRLPVGPWTEVGRLDQTAVFEI